MRSPDGAFYASLDADSEGEEGRFYAWTREEVGELLAEDQYEAFSRRFGLNGDPGFEGKWHLAVGEPFSDTAAALNRSEALVADTVDAARGDPARGSQEARLAGPRRQTTDVVECAHDSRAGNCGQGPAKTRPGRRRGGGDGFP